MGVGLKGMRLKDISVYFFEGRPLLKLENNAKAIFDASGAKTIHLSLSHEKENAIAFVIIEG